MLKSRTRGCRRAALALESPARNRSGITTDNQSAVKLVPEPRKPAKGRPDHASRPPVLKHIPGSAAPCLDCPSISVFFICCRCRLCLQSLFLQLRFLAVAIVFVLSLTGLASVLGLHGCFDWWACFGRLSSKISLAQRLRAWTAPRALCFAFVVVVAFDRSLCFSICVSLQSRSLL